MADKCLSERREKVSCLLVFHEHRIPYIVARVFKSDARLSKFVDAVAVTREAFGDKCLESPPVGAALSTSPAAGDDQGDLGLGEMPLGPASGPEHRHKIHINIEYFVSRAGIPVLNIGLDVLCLAKCRLRDCLTLIKLCQMVTNDQAMVESRISEVLLLQERVCAAEED